jgi:hypothetical protein
MRWISWVGTAPMSSSSASYAARLAAGSSIMDISTRAIVTASPFHSGFGSRTMFELWFHSTRFIGPELT